MKETEVQGIKEETDEEDSDDGGVKSADFFTQHMMHFGILDKNKKRVSELIENKDSFTTKIKKLTTGG